LAPALRELLLAACLLQMFGPTQLQYPYGLPDPRLNGKNYKSVKWLLVIGFHSKTSAENKNFSIAVNKLKFVGKSPVFCCRRN
jgi:hypothetical protein